MRGGGGEKVIFQAKGKSSFFALSRCTLTHFLDLNVSLVCMCVCVCATPSSPIFFLPYAIYRTNVAGNTKFRLDSGDKNNDLSLGGQRTYSYIYMRNHNLRDTKIAFNLPSSAIYLLCGECYLSHRRFIYNNFKRVSAFLY